MPDSAVLPRSFFARSALAVARDLIGCSFIVGGCRGRIVETEAYEQDDPSSHAFRGKTARNAVMFGPPGHLYVYFVYGMHYCANVSCDDEGVGAAVLLRALEPEDGLELMAKRRGTSNHRLLCSGPARLTQALELTGVANGLPLADSLPSPGVPAPKSVPAPLVAILSRSPGAPPRIAAAPRIGVRDDGRPWRFVDDASAFVSRPVPPGAGPAG